MKQGTVINTIDGALMILGLSDNGKYVYTLGEKRGFEHWSTGQIERMIAREVDSV